MKKILHTLVLFIALHSNAQTHAASFVYNIPLDRSNFPVKDDCEDKHRFFSLLTTGFGYCEIDNRGVHDTSIGNCFGGALCKLRYDLDSFWLQLKLGIAQKILHASKNINVSSGIRLDDIIISTGYDLPIGKRSRLTISALAGFPTSKRKFISVEDFIGTMLAPFAFQKVGTGHYSIGFFIDSSLCYCSGASSKHALIAEAQFVHYFPHNRSFTFDSKNSRLPQNWRSAWKSHNIPPIKTNIKTDWGNRLDFVIGNHDSWGNHHLEIGYNPTVAFGADTRVESIGSSENFNFLEYDVQFKGGCRHTLYGDYNYLFLINDAIDGSIGLGIYYSFRPEQTIHDPKIHGIGFYSNLSFTF